jgi:hypothetical protein
MNVTIGTAKKRTTAVVLASDMRVRVAYGHVRIHALDDDCGVCPRQVVIDLPIHELRALLDAALSATDREFHSIL